jgi:glycosyltransferase involved in cell wall biosynthesis
MFLDPGVSGGPESYLRGLVPALRAEFPATRFEVATTRRGAAALKGDGWDDVTTFRADEGERLARLAAEVVSVPLHARRRGADLVHDLVATGAPWTPPGLKHVITLHDVTHFRHTTFAATTTLAMRTLMRGTIRDADQIVTGAGAARDEAVATLGLDPARFTVVHHGTRAIGPAAPEDDVRATFDLPSGAPVVLNVATKRPHKNQALLIRALPHMAARGALLVLAGHPEAYDLELRALADELGVTGRVRFADRVSDPELEALWKLAAVAAFPTRQEGFGLPVVEALARGVPVACSDIPVLREVGGDHVRLFDPDDPAGTAAALDAALGGPVPGGADAAREYGLSFTWARAARETFAVYERACSTSA